MQTILQIILWVLKQTADTAILEIGRVTSLHADSHWALVCHMIWAVPLLGRAHDCNIFWAAEFDKKSAPYSVLTKKLAIHLGDITRLFFIKPKPQQNRKHSQMFYKDVLWDQS